MKEVLMTFEEEIEKKIKGPQKFGRLWSAERTGKFSGIVRKTGALFGANCSKMLKFFLFSAFSKKIIPRLH
jgi:hypothetical protein